MNMNMNMNMNMIVIIYQDEPTNRCDVHKPLWDEENAEVGDNRAMPPGLEGPRKFPGNSSGKFCVFVSLAFFKFESSFWCNILKYYVFFGYGRLRWKMMIFTLVCSK